MSKRFRFLGFAAFALVVLGALGYAAGGRRSGAPALSTDDAAGVGTEVTVAIDNALGRPATGTISATPSARPALSFDTAKASTAPRPLESAPGSSAPAGGGTLPDALPSQGDRKIVQTASVRLQVKEVGGAFEEVGRIATAAGGFVASSNFSLQGESQIATATIRVPATRYQEVLSQVRTLGVKVESETSNASDVTEEFSDLGARLRTLEATETQLLQLLGQAKNINEVLQVQDRLNSTRGQIEQVKGRMALLDKLSDLATLTVHLRPVVAVARNHTGGTDLGAKVSEAWDGSIEFLGAIAGGVLTVVVFAWWVPIFAVPGYVALGRLMRTHPEEPKAVAAYD